MVLLIESYHAFVIREADGGRMVGVTERAALRFLRRVRPESRVYIRPVGKKDLGDGRSMWEFEAYAQAVNQGSPSTGRTPPAGSEPNAGGSDETPF